MPLMKDETTEYLSKDARVTVLWRAVMGLVGLAGTVFAGLALAVLVGASKQLQDQSTELVLIKHQMADIRNSMLADKTDFNMRVENLDKRLQAFRDFVESDRRDINALSNRFNLFEQKMNYELKSRQ